MARGNDYIVHFAYKKFRVFSRDKENDEIEIILAGHGRLNSSADALHSDV